MYNLRGLLAHRERKPAKAIAYLTRAVQRAPHEARRVPREPHGARRASHEGEIPGLAEEEECLTCLPSHPPTRLPTHLPAQVPV